jgi:lysophospholipase L1-like esterase
MHHVVLCGDSIFDNHAYVNAGEPDVARQVRERLPQGSRATLLARDGDVTAGVEAQLRQLAGDATHLFISVGGNDALGHYDMLASPASSFAEVLDKLAEVGRAFEARYRAMLASALSRGLPTTVCTIYYPRFAGEDLSRLGALGVMGMSRKETERLQRDAVTALTIFNDAILCNAFRAGIPVIDLRLVCDEDSDYANPIEPSARGGDKIAERIVEVLRSHDFSRKRSELFC